MDCNYKMKTTYIRINTREEMYNFSKWFAKASESHIDSFGYPAFVEPDGTIASFGYTGIDEPVNELPAIFEVNKDEEYGWKASHMSIDKIEKSDNPKYSDVWLSRAILFEDFMPNRIVKKEKYLYQLIQQMRSSLLLNGTEKFQ